MALDGLQSIFACEHLNSMKHDDYDDNLRCQIQIQELQVQRKPAEDTEADLRMRVRE